MSAPAAPGGRARRRERVRADLLDAAERVFAERGYAGAGLREVTDRAGVRLAAVSDHFGGKDQLLRAVLRRRIDDLNHDRRARYALLPRTGPRRVRLGRLVRAFTEPMLDRAADPGWRHYFRFTAQLANSADPVQILVADDYNAIAADTITELGRLYRAAPDDLLAEAYQLLLAPTLQLFADNRRLDSLTAGRVRTDALRARHDRLVRFLVGGIDGLCRGATSGDH